MKDIICPNCGTTFQVDECVYSAILQQVRSKEFEQEIARRVKELDSQYEAKQEVIKTKTEQTYDKKISDKELELTNLKNEVSRLKEIIDGYDESKKSEIDRKVLEKEKEYLEQLGKREKKISELEAKIVTDENEHKISILKERSDIANEMQEKDKKIIELKSELKAGELAAQNRENQLKEAHELQLRDRQAEIERLKDFKLRMSTKMVGETLEQHCSYLFEEAQSNGLYPDAVFTKDNVVIEGTKGDFIFRDFIDGEEYVSIMFEMKNEMDATVSKHRNEDFLDKLDKDRNRKNCQYAILVSMLELDNPAYENGIVDKSHRFPKMLVIRPQFFMQIIRIISERAKEAYRDRRALAQQLEEAQTASRDFTKFDEKLNSFREKIAKNVGDAHKKYLAATQGIDKAIEALEKQIKALRDIKDNFEKSENHLAKATEFVDENLTIKKLTYGNPTIKRLIEEASQE